MELKELIKDNYVNFDSYRAGFLYYNIDVTATFEKREHLNITHIHRKPESTYQFPVPLEDVGNATLLHRDKAITFMRWIRKAKEDGTLIKL